MKRKYSGHDTIEIKDRSKASEPVGNRRDFATLVEVIARLRGPGGCPWDREQTHASLRENLLSEAYEALEALDQGDPQKLREELGDLLLQIVLHAQIARDNDEFDIGDVISGLVDKLVYRHPHVFGHVVASTAGEVSANWEKLKEAKREEGQSLLESLPRHMPALAYAMETQRRVARVGFDWHDIEGVIEKLDEEIKELKEAASSEEKADEFGDLLFTLVNIARRMGVDSEAALRRANMRFFERFRYMENACRSRGCRIGDLSFEQQNSLWEEAKRATGEKSPPP